MAATELAPRVEALLRSEVRESSVLDYKRDPYPATEGGRKEFAKDLSAFANKDGGLLVIGVGEEGGAPKDVVGVPAADVDSVIMWLESVARSGVTPHLPGLVINQVDFDGRSIVAVSIPRGMDQPYEVASAGQRFFVRDERSVRTMSREEIKFAVSRSASLLERVDEFVDARTSAFRQHFQPYGATGALLVVTPIFDQTLTFRFDLPKLWADVPQLKSMDRRSLGTLRPQVDALHCQFDALQEQRPGYARIFRHGAVELADGYMCGNRSDGNPIPGTLLVNGLIATVRSTTDLVRKITGTDTLAIDLRLRLDPGRAIAFYNDWDGSGQIDRFDVELDRLFLSALEIDKEAMHDLLRPMLDQLWQAFGFMNCGYFKEDGRFEPPR